MLPCKGGYNLQLTDSNVATCVCNGAQDNPFAVLDCDDKKDAIILRVCVHIATYVSMYVGMCSEIRVVMISYLSIVVCIYVCMYVCVYVCMYVFMYDCI